MRLCGGSCPVSAGALTTAALRFRRLCLPGPSPVRAPPGLNLCHRTSRSKPASTAVHSGDDGLACAGPGLRTLPNSSIIFPPSSRWMRSRPLSGSSVPGRPRAAWRLFPVGGTLPAARSSGSLAACGGGPRGQTRAGVAIRGPPADGPAAPDPPLGCAAAGRLPRGGMRWCPALMGTATRRAAEVARVIVVVRAVRRGEVVGTGVAVVAGPRRPVGPARGCGYGTAGAGFGACRGGRSADPADLRGDAEHGLQHPAEVGVVATGREPAGVALVGEARVSAPASRPATVAFSSRIQATLRSALTASSTSAHRLCSMLASTLSPAPG